VHASSKEADNSQSTPIHIEEVQKLLASNRVAFLFTDGGFHGQYGERLGDVLVEYVESGNALIMGTFSNAQPGNKKRLNSFFSVNFANSIKLNHQEVNGKRNNTLPS